MPEGIQIRQVKYLNNIVEQDHRLLKKQVRSMLGFKSFYTAKSTTSGIEAIHMIKKVTYFMEPVYSKSEHLYQSIIWISWIKDDSVRNLRPFSFFVIYLHQNHFRQKTS